VSTDLFAVGVVLYELLCNGHHPYEGSKPMTGEHVIPPDRFRPDLADALSGFLLKACAPDRASRFATADEMRDALRDARDHV
jgi:serine/threonine protein kinase